jgi:vacuolar protein sorting-associated protein 13A/C
VQGILALTIEDLGMSLTRMSNIADSVRFLDNIDLTFSLDSRSTTFQQLTSIEVGAKPIVFRASYHDINLIMNITNKALEMYGNTANARAQKSESSAKSTPDSVTAKFSEPATTTRAAPRHVASANVITSKEQVRVRIIFSWTSLTYELAQSYIRRTEGCPHWRCTRAADVALEDQAIQC